jgi:hypothetical protein
MGTSTTWRSSINVSASRSSAASRASRESRFRRHRREWHRGEQTVFPTSRGSWHREVYRNDWTGLTEPRVVGEALECLRELGWIRAEAAIARDGGRPTVRFHINPRVT